MVGFLLKCLFVIALVYFAVNKGSLGLSGAPAQQEVRTSAEHRAASAKTEPLTALQRPLRRSWPARRANIVFPAPAIVLRS